MTAAPARRTAARRTAVPPATVGQLGKAALHWIAANFWKSLTAAIVSGVIGYVANLVLMLIVYNGFHKTGNGPATGQGNLINGSLIWGLGSTVFFGLVGYRRAVGGERFWRDIRGLPALAQKLLHKDGRLAHVHLLWGAGIALLTMQFISPWLGAILAVGLFTALPSFLMKVMAGFLMRVWSAISGRFGPGVAPPVGPIGMVVGMLGGTIALAAGFFIGDPSLKFLMAAGCGGAAWFLARRGLPPATPGLVLLVLGAGVLCALAIDLLPALVFADDGGLPENNGSITQWWASSGSRTLLIYSTPGGAAGALGAPLGMALGNLNGLFLDEPPGDDFWDDWGDWGDDGWSDGESADEPAYGEEDANAIEIDEMSGPRGIGEMPPAVGPSEPPPPAPPPPPHEGQVDAATGRVWSENYNDWLNRDFYDQERSRTARFESTLADQRSQAEAATRAASQAESAQTAQMAHDIAAQQAAIAAQKAADDAQREAIAAKLRAAYAAEGRSTSEINELAAAGDTNTLKDLYGEHLHDVIDKESAEAGSQERWAQVYDVGYYASRATLAAAKTGMMVAGGPAGYIAAGVGSGVLRAAEEGANTYVETGSLAQTVGATAGGFVSGVKDGVVGRFTNLPGTGTATKILLPAVADAADTYVRTGDARAALGGAALSVAGGSAGHLVGGIKNTLVREGSQVILGGSLGAAGNVLAGGSAGEGFLGGAFESAGGSLGGRVAHGYAGMATTRVNVEGTPLTPKEFQLNLEAGANAAKGRALVEDYYNARTPEDRAAATHAILENRDAKLLMKSDTIKDSTRTQFALDTDEHRTQALYKATAENLTNATTATGEPRFRVREADPTAPGGFRDREVRPSDFQSGSGTAGSAPGQDLDFYTKHNIVDLETGRPARPEHIDAVVGQACNDLGISKSKQEINFVHSTHPEAFKLQPGETPADFIARARTLSGGEGQSVTEVNTHKLVEAKALHDPSGALAEQCRTATKDFNRLTKPLLDSHPSAQLPDQFKVSNSKTGDTALDIIRKVGEGKMPPGTANAQFRQLTGMNLEQGTVKMASWAEGIAKGAPPTSHLIPGSNPLNNAQSVVRSALHRTKHR